MIFAEKRPYVTPTYNLPCLDVHLAKCLLIDSPATVKFRKSRWQLYQICLDAALISGITPAKLRHQWRSTAFSRQNPSEGVTDGFIKNK